MVITGNKNITNKVKLSYKWHNPRTRGQIKNIKLKMIFKSLEIRVINFFRENIVNIFEFLMYG